MGLIPYCMAGARFQVAGSTRSVGKRRPRNLLTRDFTHSRSTFAGGGNQRQEQLAAMHFPWMFWLLRGTYARQGRQMSRSWPRVWADGRRPKPSPIDNPERPTGKKLFIVSRGDSTGTGLSRPDQIRRQYEAAPEPKELLAGPVLRDTAGVNEALHASRAAG
jgi:hypothetical protein